MSSLADPCCDCIMPSGPRALAYRLASLVLAFHKDFDPEAGRYPATNTALVALESALQTELPPWGGGAGKRRRGPPKKVQPANARTVRLLRARLAYALRSKKILAAELAVATKPKDGSTIRPEWLVKVCLSKPLTSARGYAQAFADLCPGDGVAGCSRTTITAIKDAFVEVVKNENVKEISSTIAAVAAQARVARISTPAALCVRAVVMLHLQDEADMRLRSMKTCNDPPSRGRSSKVQQHAVTLRVAGSAVDVITEVEALADKRAVTLATSLDGVLRSTLAAVVEGIGESDDVDWWYMHVVVGDNIGTNGAAAKLLLSMARAAPPGGRRVRYFLVGVKCGTHLASLSTKQAVVGHAAAAGALNTAAVAMSDDPAAARKVATGSAAVHNVVCGVITRLYKFLLLDYYEEFRLATQSWVSTRLAIVRGDQVRAEAIQSLEGLVALYTERVLPRDLLRWWNNGLDSMQHRLAMEDEPRFDADPAGFRAYIVGEIAEALRKHCLVVDEHPTLSRFFTFIEHINRLWPHGGTKKNKNKGSQKE